MDEQQQHEVFRAALSRWIVDAVALMKPNLGRYVRHEERDEWRPLADDQYRREPVDVSYWALGGWPTAEPGEEVRALPAYEELLSVGQQTPPLASMFGNLVGAGGSASAFDFFVTVAVGALPKPELVEQDEPYSIDRLCNAMMERIVATEQEFTTTCYLQGISCAIDRIDLAPHLTIERLTPRDVAVGLRYGLLVSPLSGDVPLFNLVPQSSFALKSRWRVPRTIGEPTSAQTQQFQTETAEAQLAVDQLLESLALMTDERMTVAGILTTSTGPRGLARGDGYWFTSLPAPRLTHSHFALDEGLCTRLQQLWKRPSDASAQGKALALAIRRLSFATQRDRLDDRLLDLFVAAEAFYLTDVGDAKDKGELKYRLALRAAVWSEGTLQDWTRREVFRHMKIGYDLRSTIVHGSSPRPRDIKVKGTQAALGPFVAATEEILRAGLHKALTQLVEAKHIRIPWDDMVLPD